MGCGAQYEIINTIDKTLRSLRRLGIDETNPIIGQLTRARGAAFGSIGSKVPRSVLDVIRIAGLSPGSIRVFFDVETGWLSEARPGPGAPPVYHSIDSETAVRIIKRDIDHQLEDYLMTPDTYMGE